MQNDLISRSALLAIFNHDLKCFETGKKAEKEMYISVADMRKMISEQPTAFNVEKVVEQLNELSISAGKDAGLSEDASDVGYCYGEQHALEKAIEIVKRGGVDE